jgi:serine/threonine-protein phosphatase 2A regulatory subunit B''
VQETAEFQEHYAHTVVFRILYILDRTEKGLLTLADVKRGNLAQAMSQLDREEDINKVLRFFSYEHFYVMYCKVWCSLCIVQAVSCFFGCTLLRSGLRHIFVMW